MTAKLSIREAQKALTRQRIVDAARHLFYEHGFYSTSVDQIAVEAGASRPTFYLHFKDKEEVLGQIAEDYAQAVGACAESFPSPDPTVEQLKAWLYGLGEFLEREKAAFHLGANPANPPLYAKRILQAWKEGLSARAPAFAAGMRKGKRRADARAACDLMVIEITWASRTAWLKGDPAFTEGGVSMVAKHLYDFLRDPRFADPEASAG
jgi:AcrR family transcriptional regulator